MTKGREQLTANFERREFACRCGCGLDMIDFKVVATCQRVRDYFGVPVHVTSGARCEPYNRRIGGRRNSTHLLMLAADIVVADVPARRVQAYLHDLGVTGLGSEPDFTHFDWRKTANGLLVRF